MIQGDARLAPNLFGLVYAVTGYANTTLLSLAAMLALCAWIAHTWRDDLTGISVLAAVAVVTADHAGPADLLLLLPMLAMSLPAIRWRSLSAALFLLLATPLMQLPIMALNGLWFIAPLVLLFASCAVKAQAPPTPTGSEMVTVNDS